MTDASGAAAWVPEFVGLPLAEHPPAPDEPGGSLGRFDTKRWRPDVIETIGGYVSLQTAAELFDVQRERLQMACHRGVLPGKRLSEGATPGTGRGGQNGMWLVHPGDVARYLASTLRGVSRKRRADEMSPQRLERERQRLVRSAANAERKAAEERAKAEQLKAQLQAASATGAAAPDPALKKAQAKVRFRSTREDVYAKNRARVARDLERQQQALAEAAAQRAAWIRESGVDPELIDEIDALDKA